MTFRIIEKQPRRHKKDREIYLKGSTIDITGRKDKRAATLLMRQALLEGCSVIVAGDAPGYPVTMPSSCIFMRFDAELLKGAIAPPWIRGLTNMALNAREDVLRTKMRLPAFTGTGRLLPDPTDRPCYYEIDLSTPSRHGAKKGGLFAEALLASLMEQYSTNDGGNRPSHFHDSYAGGDYQCADVHASVPVYGFAPIRRADWVSGFWS